ncbi:MAG: SlyX family protein [Rhodoferax sp.]|nr:SlyX family protein [Rhodoferax sp.]
MNTPSESPTDHSAARTDARLTELEIKVSYAEDTLDQLDQTIIRQQAQIELLLRELTLLRQQQGSEGSAPRNLRDDLPPHY